ncbi:MAG: Gfo/Idh/MocA family protein [Thermoguttaceae bacterium]
MNRRNFLTTSLKTSAMIGAGLSAGLSVSRSAHAAGSDIIKVGLIGCGGRGIGAAVQAMNSGPDVKIVAIGDYFKERAKNGATSLKNEKPEQVDIADDRIFDGFENDKGVIASGADVILIACAAKFHPLYSLRAIEAGKHVFCEKPNAIDASGIHTLEKAVQLAQEKKLSFISGLQSRHNVQYQALVEKIHDGAIGDVRAIQSAFLRSPYGVRGYPEGMSETDVQIYNQYMFRWCCGDDFTQSLVHNVDRMTWVLNGKTPTHAVGMGGRASMIERKYGDVFDHHHATFYYPNDECRLFAWCRTETGCYGNYDDIILGSKGTAYWNATKIVGETNWQYDGPKGSGGYQEEQNLLFDSVRNGKNVDSGDFVVKSTMMAILGQVACYTGTSISWDEMYNSKFTFKPSPEECVAGMEPPVKPGPDGSYPVPIPGQHSWW